MRIAVLWLEFNCTVQVLFWICSSQRSFVTCRFSVWIPQQMLRSRSRDLPVEQKLISICWLYKKKKHTDVLLSIANLKNYWFHFKRHSTRSKSLCVRIFVRYSGTDLGFPAKGVYSFPRSFLRKCSKIIDRYSLPLFGLVSPLPTHSGKSWFRRYNSREN